MWSEVLDLVRTGAIVAGTWCAIVAYLRTRRAQQTSLDAQVFLSLAERHSKLIGIRRMDADYRLDDVWDGDPDSAHSVREYFDLLAHEFELVRLGILDEKIWGMWQGDIARLVNTRLVSSVWRERTRALHRASPGFVGYIDGLIVSSAGPFRDGHTGGSVRVGVRHGVAWRVG